MLENFENLLYAHNITKITANNENTNENESEKNYVIKLILVTQEPTKFPYKTYQEISSLAQLINKLVYHISQDDQNIQNDNLVSLLTRIKKIKRKKELDIVFLRTDYLLDGCKPIQVEINTISCAFLFLGPKINKVHHLYNNNTLVSNSDDEFISMTKEVYKHYVNESNKTNDNGSCDIQNPVFLMIDNNTELACSNFYEKIEIIKRMKENNVDVIHITYKQLQNEMRFVKKDGTDIKTDVMNELFAEHLVKGMKIDFDYDVYYKNRKIFFIYYRWFYNYTHYTEEDITIRAQLECSSAVSLPSVELQIVGSKLFQIKMKDKNYLQKYIEQNEIARIYDYFGDFKSFTDYENGDEDKYILKSVNEGGGNNIFGKDIQESSGDKTKMFLIKIINSPVFANKFFGDSKDRLIIPEIGIMGWALIKNGEIVVNKQAGYICRSKDQNSKECGVSCGFGALDSILKD